MIIGILFIILLIAIIALIPLIPVIIGIIVGIDSIKKGTYCDNSTAIYDDDEDFL